MTKNYLSTPLVMPNKTLLSEFEIMRLPKLINTSQTNYTTTQNYHHIQFHSNRLNSHAGYLPSRSTVATYPA